MAAMPCCTTAGRFKLACAVVRGRESERGTVTIREKKGMQEQFVEYYKSA
jgi:hypothetical protein